MSVMNLFKKKESEEQRNIRELIDALNEARDDIHVAQLQFDNATDPELVEASVYEISSAKARYNFLLRRAREHGATNLDVFRNHR